MYTTEYEKARKRELFTSEISERSFLLGERLPTLEKRLDRYFDSQMEVIIEEWGLITTRDLAVLERRLEDVSGKIKKFESGKTRLEKRVSAVDVTLKEMERL